MQTYVLEDNGTDQIAKPAVLLWEGDLDALGGLRLWCCPARRCVG